ncbi:type II toxin-antitoxin system VapB family antitoxin [Sphingomonas sp. DG1-23]|jgi:antitoxin VapB|uniref:type II toxin-antitoxin system VapB family antitoxin n=1 Tax=Sphingomonas sp. DG1-23 TaxID=3068316 RepID=UPI00273FA89C|nr:type II toxin-antitoxin system VapB family antitoxin [Sphingomonas sp. DG1-23]MDP5279557.1 type II toxin-antitoxin system VapB family antitoxin [Sphingomonas sp. DG1-23]
MGAQLNIKSVEARDLAERLAESTGATITEAVTEALRRRLRDVEREQALQPDMVRAREDAFYALICGSRARWKGAMLSIDHADLLYDEDGLPR